MKYKEASWVSQIGGQWFSGKTIPCPECKSEAMVRCRAGGYVYVRCTNEYCQLETSEYYRGSSLEMEKKVEKEAIEAWNHGIYCGHYKR